jgi:hypothetical protein
MPRLRSGDMEKSPLENNNKNCQENHLSNLAHSTVSMIRYYKVKSGLYRVSGIQCQDKEVEQGGGHELQEERRGSGGSRGSSLRLRRLRWHL